MKKIFSLFLLFCIFFTSFSNVFAYSYATRDEVDASTDTSITSGITLYDVLCQLPDSLREEMMASLTEKSSVRLVNDYYSLVGFEAYSAYNGLVIVRRQKVDSDICYYDLILSTGEHLCYTRTSDILSLDGSKHYNGFIISGPKQMIRLNNYINGVGHFSATNVNDTALYTYTDAGDQYICDVVFSSITMTANDGTYSQITLPAMNNQLNPYLHFNWGDHLTLNTEPKIEIIEEYNISDKTSILNISIANYSVFHKLYYSNVMPGIDGELKTKTDLQLDTEGKATLTLNAYQSLYFQLEDKDR